MATLTILFPNSDPGICGDNTLCSNNQGGFECACLSGFSSPTGIVDAATGCVDMDECALGIDFCGDGPIALNCTNSNGGYDCTVPDPATLADGDGRESY